MLKAIIADDEDIIRQGISDFVDWESLGMQLVGQASNGKEAAELLEDCQPEIVITDVKMPVMSGIELLALAKEKCPDSEVIMISSYDEFQYAQQSLNLGAFAYLLKPIDTDRLLELLDKAGKKIRKVREERDAFEEIQSDAFDSRLKVLVFSGKKVEFREDEKSSLERFHRFSVITVYADRPVFRTETFETALRDKIGQWKEEQSSDLEIKQFYNQSLQSVFCVFHCSERSAAVQKLLDIYRQFFETVVLGVSQTAETAMALGTLYEQSMEAVDYRFFTEDKIIVYDKIEQEIYSAVKDVPDWAKELERRMELGSEQVEVLPREMMDYMYRTKPPKGMVRTAVSAVLYAMFRLIREAGGKPEDLFLSVSDMITEILDERDLERMADKLKAALREAALYKEQLEKLRPNSLLFKAKQYIQEHYQEPDLRLEDVANDVYVNPSYFSSLFRKEEGISFGEYLTKLRMEKAIELLKNSRLKIYEVAFQVGYQNVSWFTVAFKKYTGMKPGDFRR